jgi:MerR family transcriptional regulator, light-induced transcriptional regulator
VIITGRRSSLDTIGRIVYTVRSMRAAPPVLDYRNAVRETPASTLARLDERPLAARDQLLDLLQHGSPSSLAA